MVKIAKKTIVKIWSNIASKKYSELYSIAKNYEYVSFDIFDTLIKRDIRRPTDIFKIIERETKIENFENKRVRAEIEARRKSCKEEVTLEEIYSYMKLYDASNADNIKKSLIELEINLEKEFCVRNEAMYEFYDDCIKMVKKFS